MEQALLRRKAATDTSGRQLRAEVLEVPTLPVQVIEEMFALYHSYYEATSPARFNADLQGKDKVILLYDESQALRGFSTLRLLECQWQGKPCRVLFSGDTIVHHRFWGEQTLAFNWIRLAGQIKAQQPVMPLYWLLIVKGHRTYRYLQAFSLRYFPHWKEQTPSAEKTLMDHLGERLFGDCYQPDKGVVHFAESHGQLRHEWAEPSLEIVHRQEVQFFLRSNPGYRQGDELLCLTELDAANLRPLARRVFEAGMKE